MAGMLRNVVVVVHSRVEPFELAVLCEVFGTDRSDDGLPVYDFSVVTAEPGLPLVVLDDYFDVFGVKSVMSLL